jgi:hypothetical protein
MDFNEIKSMSILKAIPFKSQSVSKPISNEFWLDEVYRG